MRSDQSLMAMLNSRLSALSSVSLSALTSEREREREREGDMMVERLRSH